jgi:hypothetical protein
MASELILLVLAVTLGVGVSYVGYRLDDGSSVERPIAIDLVSRGQELVSVKRLWFSEKLLFTLALSNWARAYQVTARCGDGSVDTHICAYDPLGFSVFRRSGLKVYSDGSWRDVTQPAANQ